MIYATVPLYSSASTVTKPINFITTTSIKTFLLVEKAIFHAYSLERRLLIIIC